MIEMSPYLPFPELVNAGLKDARDGINQMVPGRPDLIIRSEIGDYCTFDEARNLRVEFNSLSGDFGVRTSLVDIVYGAKKYRGYVGGGMFIVGKRVTGESLDEAFLHPTSDLIDKYQALCVGLARYMVDRIKTESAYLRDIASLSNFVYGRTLGGDEKPHIYLVDLEDGFTKFRFSKKDCYNYHRWLGWFADIIKNIIEAEQLGKVRLPKARKELKFILDNPPTPRLNPKALRYLRGSLRVNRIMSSDYFDEHFEDYDLETVSLKF